ncbi:Clavaminate synthase-like protein [Mycena indigotica]|uniref:Clavaminate synthase-like protein n=1 Tax=Mycena indigotica TaxID=2126181 RepID=A0A8H6VSH1_9AGAR|nr:Clavaminate synthase-like protein [Mycena indigotica]KAF7292199.1 Clavaminate synthase-like protein [Mycena indigotica]
MGADGKDAPRGLPQVVFLSGRHHHRLKMKIPVVDFAPFLDKADDAAARQAVADKLLAALHETGFVYVVNHGVEQAAVETAPDSGSPSLFGTKLLALRPAMQPYPRGFLCVGRRDRATPAELALPDPTDMKESFVLGSKDNAGMPNIWLDEKPDGLVETGFRASCLGLYEQCHALESAVFRGLALALGLPDDHFAVGTSSENDLRLVRYHPVPASAIAAGLITRAAAHTTPGALQLTFQRDVEGLEVEDPEKPGVFHPILPVPGAVLLNAGDMLQRGSRGAVRSAVHRVGAPAGTVEVNGAPWKPQRLEIVYNCVPAEDARPQHIMRSRNSCPASYVSISHVKPYWCPHGLLQR